MGVESATYINDFDSSLPSSTDLRSQGDDHLRLLKTVLKTQFTGATRTFQIPGTLSKTVDYTVVKADGESTIYITTASGSVTLTMPTLVALDAGWKIHFIKTNSGANPVFVAPPSGTISSGGLALAKARRSIPGIRITVIWDGTGFFVTRALALPIGSMFDFDGSTLPAGYEWPNGQTLASASTNYPEYNSVKGSGITLDLRGRVAVTLDNLGGSAAGRVTSATMSADGVTVGATGGTETRTLLTSNLPAYAPAGSVTTVAVVGALGNALVIFSGGGSNGFTGTGANNSGPINSVGGITWSSGFTGTAQGGTSTAFSNMQPSIICGKILVVE